MRASDLPACLSLLLILVGVLGCGAQGMPALDPQFPRDEFARELRTFTVKQWPSRQDVLKLFELADWRGMSRRAVLDLLGPADGLVEYRDAVYERELTVRGERVVDRYTDKEPYLVQPDDGSLVYRTGDGYNHSRLYTLHFEEGRVSNVVISAGY